MGHDMEKGMIHYFQHSIMGGKFRLFNFLCLISIFDLHIWQKFSGLIVSWQ